MTSFLNQFNYQFVRGSGTILLPQDLSNHLLDRWIFLHGLMGSGINFRSIAKALPSKSISLLFDQRGHGKSIKPSTGYSLNDYASDLEQIRQDLQWNQFYLVGHSMGGRVAMMYAYLYPQHCKFLIIEDIGPDAKPDASTFYKGLLDSIPTPFSNKKEARAWLMNDFLYTSYGKNGGVVLAEYLYTNLVETESNKVDWRFNKEALIETVQLGREQDLWFQWKQLSLPILVIRGENSRELDEDTFNQMLIENKNAQGIVISNAGHWVHFDQAEKFIAALKAILN